MWQINEFDCMVNIIMNACIEGHNIHCRAIYIYTTELFHVQWNLSIKDTLEP